MKESSSYGNHFNRELVSPVLALMCLWYDDDFIITGTKFSSTPNSNPPLTYVPTIES